MGEKLDFIKWGFFSFHALLMESLNYVCGLFTGMKHLWGFCDVMNTYYLLFM